MRSLHVPISFRERKWKLKLKFDNLTDEDLACEDDKIQEMFNKLIIKLGKSKEEMHRIIIAL